MPGVEQIVGEAAHEGAVTRAHQRFRRRRVQPVRAGVKGPAAGGIGRAAAAGARIGHRHAEGPAGLEPNPPGLKWLGLEVRRQTLHDADHGTVEFVARSKLGGRAQRLHEVSRFVRENGRWFYRDGDIV
jgi:hypothetical protein